MIPDDIITGVRELDERTQALEQELIEAQKRYGKTFLTEGDHMDYDEYCRLWFDYFIRLNNIGIMWDKLTWIADRLRLIGQTERWYA